ncbi:N-acetylmuramoyl-L-alanine amidase-like domain-containing protein [Salisaeta longa]|uniref:N-acetylmuramoyl-L-alanine amidase-like domain-containing protein n=1 Tax=Salisaeta longa TaxID=503170 RepID=UPI0003B2EAD7|nr:N-acetylmuramoyl-L-alanine amidase-like domain-containing protein [Salisaeta longa]
MTLCAALLCTFLLLVGCATPDDRPRAPASSSVPPAASGPTALPDSLLTPPDPATAARFDTLMAYARAADLHTEPVGRIMQALGVRFKGAPYLAGTLDAPPRETLVVRLDGFDCVTYIETLLAIAQGIARQDYRYASFARRLAAGRYRSGRMNGYCSRLHYFSDWLRDNAGRDRVQPLTQALGGRVLKDSLTFMSAHRSAYDKFATNDSLYACIQAMEARLAGQPIYYVPEDSIRAVYPKLKAGDIVGFATDLKGLDMTHTGLVYRFDDGRVGLLHASTTGGVEVLPDLQRYVQRIDTQIGIVVARPRPGA